MFLPRLAWIMIFLPTASLLTGITVCTITANLFVEMESHESFAWAALELPSF
jgi:hypothetical protein